MNRIDSTVNDQDEIVFSRTEQLKHLVLQRASTFGLLSLCLMVLVVSITVIGEASSARELEPTPAGPPHLYDGIELGVAFEIPGQWSNRSLQIDSAVHNGSVMLLADQSSQPALEFPPRRPEPGQSYAFVLVENPGDQMGTSRQERLVTLSQTGLCETEGDHFVDSEIIYRECLYFFEPSGLNANVIEATFFRGDRLLHVSGLAVSNPSGRMPDIASELAGMISTMRPLDFSAWTVRTHDSLNHEMSYPDTYRLHDTGFAYELYDTGLDRWLEWRVIYDDPAYYNIDSIEEMLSDPARLGDRSFRTTRETPTSLLHQPDRLMALYGREDSVEEIVLLAAAIPNPDAESPMEVILFQMAVSTANLDQVRPIFEQVVRGFRGKDVPLFERR